MEVEMTRRQDLEILSAEIGSPPAVDLHQADNTHDGVRQLEQFLDRRYVDGETVVKIIHGRGTGAMRRAVHEALTESPYVAYFRDAQAGHSIGGVTFAVLNTT
jgi:DNA mismatch repair protein MutS2